LEAEPAKLSPIEWSVAEITGVLENLGSLGMYDANRLHEMQTLTFEFVMRGKRYKPFNYNDA
jgi:hypothetical protein